MLAKLHIENLEVFAYHGCMEEEAMVGTRFTVDLALHYDLLNAALSDKLEDAVDYGAISELVKKELLHRNNLIETVALRLVNKIKERFKSVEKVDIKLTKHAPPINANVSSVAVSLSA
ncbi:MAG: dihydroneopterin aldolase [Luteibaculum sp.]